MGRLSLRGWLLLVSVMFALLVVGGISLTTYVIVSDGMQVVASDTTQRVAAAAGSSLRETVAESELAAATLGLQGEERLADAQRRFEEQLPELLGEGGISDAEFALYDEQAGVVWSSDEIALHPDQDAARARALRTGTPTFTNVRRGTPLAGLASTARLGITVVHMPAMLPGDRPGVLDVTYMPEIEENVINAVRLPMAVLALAATLIMVVLMQTSMAWVLRLVDDLRRAADSIDAGRLDERLPDEASNEIGDLARSLNRLIERLQRRAHAQTRFVADASHELATPVAGIRGYTSILRAWGGDDPKVREEAIAAIDRESRRMARLTSDLLNLLHADQGLRLRTERFDLHVLVRERLATTASRYLDKDLEIVGPEEESLVMVGDPDRVEDILSILLDNAGKYTEPGGHVFVTTSRRREKVTINVSDTGPGIPEEDLPRVFDRFFRTDEVRSEGEGGFGLGLSIAKSIVTSMGGTISVSSIPGEGTTFTVQLPRGRV